MPVKVDAPVKWPELPSSRHEYPDSGEVSTSVTEHSLFKTPVREVVEVEPESSSYVSPGFENAST